MVRGPQYTRDKVKMPSATGSQLLCVEAFRHTAGVFDAAGRAGSPIDAVASRCAEELDSIFVCSLMLPATGFVWHVVFYFGLFGPLPPHVAALIERFRGGDDKFRNARFKLIAKIVDGPWLVRKTVPSKPAILGKTVPLLFPTGAAKGTRRGYFGVDVDTTRSSAANRVLSVVKGNAPALVVDLAFLLEAQADDELPEMCLGSGRISHIELSAEKVPALEGE